MRSARRRLEALKQVVMDRETCERCGGRHVPDWLEFIRASSASKRICDCDECHKCRWYQQLRLRGIEE